VNLYVTEATAAPRLTSMGNPIGQFDFSILGEPGRLYRIQSSTNLIDWSEEKSFPKEFIYYGTSSGRRNGLVYNNQNVFSVPQSSMQRFYRTTDYVPPLAGCINNLGVIRFAKEIWSLENKAGGTFGATPAPSEIAPYLKNGGPVCPLAHGGSFDLSYTIGRLSVSPSCKISPFNHFLEEPEY